GTVHASRSTLGSVHDAGLGARIPHGEGLRSLLHERLPAQNRRHRPVSRKPDPGSRAILSEPVAGAGRNFEVVIPAEGKWPRNGVCESGRKAIPAAMSEVRAISPF